MRYTWTAGARSFIVHSRGQWRGWRDDTESWRGELAESALAAWKAAVTLPFPEEGILAYANPETATGTLDIETKTGTETAYFEVDNLPAELRPVDSLVERWLSELAQWTAASSSADLRRVRSE